MSERLPNPLTPCCLVVAWGAVHSVSKHIKCAPKVDRKFTAWHRVRQPLGPCPRPCPCCWTRACECRLSVTPVSCLPRAVSRPSAAPGLARPLLGTYLLLQFFADPASAAFCYGPRTHSPVRSPCMKRMHHGGILLRRCMERKAPYP